MASPSVEKLHARIDKISAEIEAQREVLEILERKRCAVKRQLNEVVDRVSRLPFELSSQIFVRCLPPRPNPAAGSIPLVLLSICNSWSEIALSTPTLWSAVDVGGHRLDLETLLETWFRRANGRMLSVSLRNNISPEIAALIGRHASQLRELHIYDDSIGLSAVAAAAPFPALENLTVGGVHISSIGFPAHRVETVLDLLRSAPNLIECTIDVEHSVSESTPEILVLPLVRQLTLKAANDPICEALALPGLRTLSVHYDTHVDEITRLLQRSPPPLQSLKFGVAVLISSAGLEKCLSVLPTLTHLDLPGGAGSVLGTVHNVLGILARSPHNKIVPQLSHLVLRIAKPRQEWYRQLHSALLARRDTIRSVQVKWAHADTQVPEPGVHASLRELASLSGMDIHVGTNKRNVLMETPVE
ncbi:hypothetical protein C8R43DRAFT_161189 [Mycena crocata]|nr:hypothetical protein C8R43DRAFT_161189 [Mycena crocata]